MATCQFDGTETEKSVCPTCNDYKGLTPLSVALDDVFVLMEQARQHYLETHTDHRDCDCDYREGEE